MGSFRSALNHLVAAYGRLNLFSLVSYDAGACSLDNADAVREHNLHYLFALKRSQRTLFDTAKLWLGSLPVQSADAYTVDTDANTFIHRRVYIGRVTTQVQRWTHLRTILRVESERLAPGGQRISHEERYFLCSLPADEITPSQWLLVVRNHWAVEISHQALDVALSEDDRPWIHADPRAALVVAILRRLAYTILSLFRSITQRSEQARAVPWRTLLADMRDALLTLTDAHLDNLRLRPRRLLSATC
jgi:hypothetical protein